MSKSPEKEVESVRQSDIALLENAQIELAFAQRHLNTVLRHIGATYQLGPDDTFDDRTGEIVRIVTMPLHKDEPTNGNGPSEQTAVGTGEYTGRPSLRVERAGTVAESAAGSSKGNEG